MKTFRYSEWDGTQNFSLDADELMDKLGRDLMTYGDLPYVLRQMNRAGLRDAQGRRLPGTQEFLQQLRQMKQRQLDKYDLSSVVDDIRKKLDDILRKERQGIQRRLDEAKEKADKSEGELSPEVQHSLLKKIEDMAARNRQKLDELPSDLGGQIKGLAGYDFMDDEARKDFQELMDMLKKHAMESYGRDMIQKLKNMDASTLANLRNMVEALNQMLEQKMRGEEPDFDSFMAQFGNYFGPESPRSFDELMHCLQDQIAQAQSLLDSLSPQDREELQSLLSSMLDDATQYELAKLASNLENLFPDDRLHKQYPFSGEESISYTEALKVMETLQKMDRLEAQISKSQHEQSLDTVDEELFKELLGDKAASELQRLREMTKLLEEAGYIQRKDNKYELTPRGIRKIGHKALQDIFAQLHKDRFGGHNIKFRGSGGDRIEETKKYEFGDDFELDLQKTIMNSLYREPKMPPLSLSIDDFEVLKREGTTRTAIVLMLDMSLSMFMNGYFEAAKRTAMAFDSLIRSQYPKDSLHIVGFSQFARVIKPKDLLYIGRDLYERGTNLQHALNLAGTLLDKERSTNKQIILISDGEPTAHIDHGNVYFQYPPSLRTLQLTLREVRNCTQKGIVINTFMFDDSQFLSSFVTAMAHLNGGRVFFANADNLGKYVLFDYVSGKRKVIW